MFFQGWLPILNKSIQEMVTGEEKEFLENSTKKHFWIQTSCSLMGLTGMGGCTTHTLALTITELRDVKSIFLFTDVKSSLMASCTGIG